MFDEAAARLGVELVLATDRCDQPRRPVARPGVPGAVPRRGGVRGAVLARRAARGSTACWPSATARWCSRRWSPTRLGCRGTPSTRARASRDKRRSRERCAPPACRCRGPPPCRSGRPARCSSDVPLPVRGQAARALGQPRRHARRRSAQLRAAWRACAALLASPDVREMRDPAADVIQVEGYIDGRRIRGRRRAGSRHAPRAGDLRQARPARRAVLRGDDLRHAVARAPTPRRRRSRGGRRRRPGRSACGTAPSTPNAASTAAASWCWKWRRGRSAGCVRAPCVRRAAGRRLRSKSCCWARARRAGRRLAARARPRQA